MSSVEPFYDPIVKAMGKKLVYKEISGYGLGGYARMLDDKEMASVTVGLTDRDHTNEPFRRLTMLVYVFPVDGYDFSKEASFSYSLEQPHEVVIDQLLRDFRRVLVESGL